MERVPRGSRLGQPARPRHQPASDIPAARYRRQVIELLQRRRTIIAATLEAVLGIELRQRLQHPQRIARAPDPTARKTQRRPRHAVQNLEQRLVHDLASRILGRRKLLARIRLHLRERRVCRLRRRHPRVQTIHRQPLARQRRIDQLAQLRSRQRHLPALKMSRVRHHRLRSCSLLNLPRRVRTNRDQLLKHRGKRQRMIDRIAVILCSNLLHALSLQLIWRKSGRKVKCAMVCRPGEKANFAHTECAVQQNATPHPKLGPASLQ